MRQDGTCAYYFDKDELKSMIEQCHVVQSQTQTSSSLASPISSLSATEGAIAVVDEADDADETSSRRVTSSSSLGMHEIESSYVTRQYANRQQQKARYRVWVHGRFQKNWS